MEISSLVTTNLKKNLLSFNAIVKNNNEVVNRLNHQANICFDDPLQYFLFMFHKK